MSINQSTILKIARRIVAMFLLAASAMSAFAILGDKGRTPKNHSFLSNQSLAANSTSFSLKSRYNYRGSQIIDPARTGEYIDLNTTITFQKGNTTYVVPLKKKIFITSGHAGFTINH